MAQKNYNIAVLNSLNKARAGNKESFTIGYTISNDLLEKVSGGGILHSRLSAVELPLNILSALHFWKDTFNTIYSSNKKVSGSFALKFVNNSDSDNDLNMGIKGFKGKDHIQVKGNTISLNLNTKWKALPYSSGVDIFSHIVYGMGKILQLGDSQLVGTVMNKSHLQVNYMPHYSLHIGEDGIVANPISIIDKNIIKSIKRTYGDMTYSYPIVYGCTDPNADNFNPKATRPSKSCIYSKRTFSSPYTTKNINK
tara:strand:- start:1770 stop:2528 length:759 start_codon:yes stop_codon:yes gene_type:complete